ncbi:hypothetical protein ACJX0J_029537, partial [Zea mays]
MGGLQRATIVESCAFYGVLIVGLIKGEYILSHLFWSNDIREAIHLLEYTPRYILMLRELELENSNGVRSDSCDHEVLAVSTSSIPNHQGSWARKNFRPKSKHQTNRVVVVNSNKYNHPNYSVNFEYQFSSVGVVNHVPKKAKISLAYLGELKRKLCIINLADPLFRASVVIVATQFCIDLTWLTATNKEVMRPEGDEWEPLKILNNVVFVILWYFLQFKIYASCIHLS